MWDPDTVLLQGSQFLRRAGMFLRRAGRGSQSGGEYCAPTDLPSPRKEGFIMSELVPQIAERIRGLREMSDLSLETLAHELDIPLPTYAGYESGAADIPVGVLHELAHRFNVEFTALLTGEEPRLHEYCLVRKGRGVTVQRRKEYKYESLGFNFLHKKAEPLIVTVAPGADDAEPPATNTHDGQEFDYVLEGALKVVIAGHEVILREGDSLYFDADKPHGMKALEGNTARFLAIII